MPRPHTFSRQTMDVARLLGLEVARARRARRWTLEALAERAGVSVPTLRKVEQGDLSVALGTALEVATLLGIPLLAADRTELGRLLERSQDKLALLPARVRARAGGVDDDF
jgi:transcriptional regulator with XRE-family HTH domain